MKNFWDFRRLKEEIKKCRRIGFSQVRFPGGTSYDGSLNSTIIKLELSPFGELYFIIVLYDFNSKIINENFEIKEDKYHLSVRKFKEETGILINICNIGRPIWEIVVDDNRFKNHKTKHTKYFFLYLGKNEGGFIDLSNSSYLKRETIPLLVPGWFIPKVLFHRHLEAFEIAINKIDFLIKNEDRKLIKMIENLWLETKNTQNKEIYIDYYLQKMIFSLNKIKKSIEERKNKKNKNTEKL